MPRAGRSKRSKSKAIGAKRVRATKPSREKRRVLVCCALPYTNAVPHIGNIVGSHLPADIFARYCRLKGYETLFIGGADENGTPTEVAAIELKVTPRRLTDVFYGVHKMIYDWFEISYDNFSRTSLPIHHKTTHDLFLELEKLQPSLEAWITSQKHWRKQVSSLALAWIKEGLRRRSITRDLKWGVPVPLEGFKDKIFYVWFDAPIGYISSTKEWAEKSGHPRGWEPYWLDPETRIYNFLGKDNIPFHTIFWPGMLMAHGDLNLPYDVVGLQYCNYEGDKISKSKNWGIFCEKVVKSGLDPDIWRYYLAYLIPETKDTEFQWD